ncbi:ligand-binding sensor domain-containing protein [Chitinophaga barathri]|uniref:histidine kinase n=1 Tax=Chitinophaga barathri TaxID=1647451 RepID=A0A3N4N3B6_9BACT|nr:sensor histidine kinase [Chitinophaga barathri]RPD42103.1 histidine kinase [Chitinophaga barathri]
MKKRIFILLLIALSAGHSANAQKYYFRHYQVENGLSHNTVFCVQQDQQGFIWMGTKDGLNRFDGHAFKVFRNIPGDSTSLASNFVYSLDVDPNGQLWVGASIGLYRYHPVTESFEMIKGTGAKGVGSVKCDKKGLIWFMEGYSLYSYDPIKDTLIHHLDPAGREDAVTDINIDDAGNIWLGSWKGTVRTFNSSKAFDIFSHSPKVTYKQVTVIMPASGGRLLVGTSNQGLKLLDPHKGTYEDLMTRTNNDVAIYVRHILHHQGDEYWIATESGIYVYNLATRRYINLKKEYNNPYSLTDNAVYYLHKDKEGGMWAGTFFGGSNYYPRQYTYFQKWFPDNSSNTLSGNAVREICEDRFGNIWAGTEDNGINKIDPATGKITQYQPCRNANGISHTNIHGLYAEGNNLWIGTLDNGLDKMDIRSGQVVKHYAAGPGSFSSNFILWIYKARNGSLFLGTGSELAKYDHTKDAFLKTDLMPNSNQRSIAESEDGTIWAATADNGLYWFNEATGQKGNYRHNPGDTCSLSANSLNTVFIDSRQQIWTGSEGFGLNRLTPATGCFKRYTTQQGLPSDYIFKVLEDDRGNMWVTTSRGLACLNPNTGAIQVFTSINGLLNDQFNYNSGYKDKNGRMYLGSVKGMISFNPDQFLPDTFVAPVYITGFNVKNKATAREDKRALFFTKKIVLPYDQSSFSIDFAALSFTAPDMISYAYMMEGLDKEWTYLKTNRIVYFTDLKPGRYTFRVSTTDNNGKLGDHPAWLEIEIRPPYWATSWAYVLYAVIVASAAYYFIRRYHIRQTLKHKRKLEELQLKKEKELYQAKVDFLTNVAHEINTPLTLIKGPLEQVIENPERLQANRNHLQIMERNTNRLVQLTNQLLDFRQTEATGFRLDFKRLNISSILQDTFDNFRLPAAQKKLDFRLKMTTEDIYAYADEEGINKIFSNLFSNAIKYADKNVKITLRENGKDIILEVTNDGPLIPEEMREKIFAPFVRLKENEKQKGTGIGLSICRSLTVLHKGELYAAQSEDGLNTFVLTLPVGQAISTEI